VVKFEAVLTSDPGGGGGTFITIPEQVAAKLGLSGMPKIQAVIAGAPYRGSLRPMGDGTYGLGVLKSIQAGAGVGAGDRITVLLELDAAPRTVEVPADLASVLAGDKNAAATWERLSYTNRKELAGSIESAKKPETRERRLNAAIARLKSG
jgi:hypothetical protein